MIRQMFLLAVLSCVVCSGTVALAGQQHEHAAPTRAEASGSVSFPISCAPAVQTSFERDIALLHSFGYNAAEARFKQIERDDPGCAMANSRLCVQG